MAKDYVFYNPLAGEGKILEDLELLPFVLDEDCVFCDMTKPETYARSLFAMEETDRLILCGGDGTLNRFVNILEDIHRPNEILYYPCGENNDFARDFGREYGCNPFPVTKALRNLPQIRIGSRTGRLLTGVVFTCRKQTVDLKLSTDRALHHYEKVCFAALMQGRHCKGGWIPDPLRQPTDTELSCVVIHGCGWGKARRLLKKLQKGNIPNSRNVCIHRGRNIRLSFRQPVAVCVDGEQMTQVSVISAVK